MQAWHRCTLKWQHAIAKNKLFRVAKTTSSDIARSSPTSRSFSLSSGKHSLEYRSGLDTIIDLRFLIASAAMRLQSAESTGPAAPGRMQEGPEKPLKEFTQTSTNLPFGQQTALSTIGGPTYVTAQTLIQQVAYSLSDRLWTYSPEHYDLDFAARDWYKQSEPNVYRYTTGVEAMQIRQGAASIALGYLFSKDFDLKKRYVPQSIIASSSTLQYLRSALEELSLMYSVASPLVAHIAAIDYFNSSSQLVSDYVSTLSIAEELGLGMVASFSTYEAQHMALFATLLAGLVPAIHVYDGASVGRETTRVIDVLDQTGLYNTYKAVQRETSALGKKRASLDNKVSQLLKSFNEELGTEYGCFEYHGPPAPDSVLVVFGTVEASLSSQVVQSLQADGAEVGLLNVRVYRPFIEEEFLDALPKSTRVIGVLGQVKDQTSMSDSSVRSNLYNDVVAAVTFSTRWDALPTIIDVKYARETIWTPISIAAAFQLLVKNPVLPVGGSDEKSNGPGTLQLLDPSITQQYSFWDVDTSVSVGVPTILAKALATDSANNVTTKTVYDNLAKGGVVRSDIRKSKKSIEASYSVDAADVVYVGEQGLLEKYDVLKSLKAEGKIILRLPGVKDEDVEKKLPFEFRRAVSEKKIQLYLLDPSAIELVAEDQALELFVTETAFLRVALPTLEGFALQKLASINGNAEILEEVAGVLGRALRLVEVPDEWATSTSDAPSPRLLSDIQPNSFDRFNKTEAEYPSYQESWQTAAKGLAFKEAYGTTNVLRPDLTTKTYTVHVKENRRLTPTTYDRNIFHIEFDLGDSGLIYNIGEALGIHSENDPALVADFIDFYHVDPTALIQVPSRSNPLLLETRTIQQSLLQNLDLFGRPPQHFYAALSPHATSPSEAKTLLTLSSPEGSQEFTRRAETDTITYFDILTEFPSAHPPFPLLATLIPPIKRREYSIASSQAVTPTTVALMIVTVHWTDPRSRPRTGHATRYLHSLPPGAPVTVSVKPSVMKLPPLTTQPIILAGLGTGLAPFRAFVQQRALQKSQGKEIGSVLLYMGSRHQREEYCYGEEWEAYRDAGVITLLGRAFSRDQPHKVYIQDVMRETLEEIRQAYLREGGAFYLCGPTWPVPDVTGVLEEAIVREGKASGGKKVDGRKEIERLKEGGRYVLEVY